MHDKLSNYNLTITNNIHEKTIVDKSQNRSIEFENGIFGNNDKKILSLFNLDIILNILLME